MNREIIADIGKIFLAVVIIFSVLAMLSDSGFTGLTVSGINNTEPFWTGSGLFQVEKNSQLTIDLDDYFSDPTGEQLTYLAAEASNMNLEVHNNILIITPEQDFIGERKLTVYASNKQDIIKQKIRIEVVEKVEGMSTAPLPQQPPPINPSIGPELKDNSDKYAGKKIADDPAFNTVIQEIIREQDYIRISFYHDSADPQPIWIQGLVDYELSTSMADAYEIVTLTVQLVDGIVPKFKLHVGADSDIFEFGKIIPDVDVEEGTFDIEDRGDEKLDVDVQKGGVTAELVVLDSENIDVKIRDTSIPEASTEVIAVEGNIINAQIILPKLYNVDAIYKCSVFDIASFTCISGWARTDIPFTDHGDYVTFNVNSFSAYFAGLTVNLTLWDTTDIPGGTALINTNITFYANYTESTGPVNGSCSIRFDTGGGFGAFSNMTYNSTTKIHEYTQSFATAGVHLFNVTCVHPAIIGKTIQGIDTFYVFSSMPTNISLQCSVNPLPCTPGKTSVFNLFNITNSHAALPNQSWGSYGICCQDVFALNAIGTNSSGFEFAKLYQNNNSHVGIPNQTTYNISAYISASNATIVCDYPKTYGNCSSGLPNGTTLQNATCLATLPTNITNSTTNLHVFDCVTNPRETSICCGQGAVEWDLRVYVDGVLTNNMTNAGEPYNITVEVLHFGMPAAGIEVMAEECNGLAPFALLQSIVSNVTNCANSIVKTGANGKVSYTNIPTGGEPSFSSPFAYTINFFAVVGGYFKDTETFTVINRAPPPAYSRGTITQNKPNVEGTNERILTEFDRVSRSRIGNAVAGENFDVIVYTNGTAVGLNITLASGRPTGFNITVVNSTSLAGIPGAMITVREDSGLLHWALIQYTQALASTNVSNYVQGNIVTDSNGNAKFSIVPTAGFPSSTVEQSIGNYSVKINVFAPGMINFTHVFNVDRSLPPPSPTQVVYNSGHIEGFNEKVLVLYDRVTKYIQ